MYRLPSHIPSLHLNLTPFLQVILMGAFSPRGDFRLIHTSPSDTAIIHNMYAPVRVMFMQDP